MVLLEVLAQAISQAVGAATESLQCLLGLDQQDTPINTKREAASTEAFDPCLQAARRSACNKEEDTDGNNKEFSISEIIGQYAEVAFTQQKENFHIKSELARLQSAEARHKEETAGLQRVRNYHVGRIAVLHKEKSSLGEQVERLRKIHDHVQLPANVATKNRLPPTVKNAPLNESQDPCPEKASNLLPDSQSLQYKIKCQQHAGDSLQEQIRDLEAARQSLQHELLSSRDQTHTLRREVAWLEHAQGLLQAEANDYKAVNASLHKCLDNDAHDRVELDKRVQGLEEEKEALVEKLTRLEYEKAALEESIEYRTPADICEGETNSFKTKSPPSVPVHNMKGCVHKRAVYPSKHHSTDNATIGVHHKFGSVSSINTAISGISGHTRNASVSTLATDIEVDHVDKPAQNKPALSTYETKARADLPNSNSEAAPLKDGKGLWGKQDSTSSTSTVVAAKIGLTNPDTQRRRERTHTKPTYLGHTGSNQSSTSGALLNYSDLCLWEDSASLQGTFCSALEPVGISERHDHIDSNEEVTVLLTGAEKRNKVNRVEPLAGQSTHSPSRQPSLSFTDKEYIDADGSCNSPEIDFQENGKLIDDGFQERLPPRWPAPSWIDKLGAAKREAAPSFSANDRKITSKHLPEAEVPALGLLSGFWNQAGGYVEFPDGQRISACGESENFSGDPFTNGGCGPSGPPLPSSHSDSRYYGTSKGSNLKLSKEAAPRTTAYRCPIPASWNDNLFIRRRPQATEKASPGIKMRARHVRAEMASYTITKEMIDDGVPANVKDWTFKTFREHERKRRTRRRQWTGKTAVAQFFPVPATSYEPGDKMIPEPSPQSRNHGQTLLGDKPVTRPAWHNPLYEVCFQNKAWSDDPTMKKARLTKNFFRERQRSSGKGLTGWVDKWREQRRVADRVPKARYHRRWPNRALYGGGLPRHCATKLGKVIEILSGRADVTFPNITAGQTTPRSFNILPSESQIPQGQPSVIFSRTVLQHPEPHRPPPQQFEDRFTILSERWDEAFEQRVQSKEQGGVGITYLHSQTHDCWDPDHVELTALPWIPWWLRVRFNGWSDAYELPTTRMLLPFDVGVEGPWAMDVVPDRQHHGRGQWAEARLQDLSILE